MAGAPAVAAAATAAPGTERVQGAGDAVRAVAVRQPPAVPAAQEGRRIPRWSLIAGAIGIFAAGTAIYLVQAPKATPSKGPAAEEAQIARATPPLREAPKQAGAEPRPPQPQKAAGPVTAESPPAGHQPRENPKDGLKYVYIPPGKFTMGCSPGDDECYAGEKPPHEVTITKNFWLGQTPVTQEAYQRIIGNNPSGFKGTRLPVENVTWNQAKSHCEAVGMRLPTEAEWEYAARAGSTGARYGNLDAIAWYDGNSGSTHEVAQKQPNALGLHDMLGNVWEWVEGEWAAYPGGTIDACAGCKVLRGGSWHELARDVRVSHRAGNKPSNGIGFRCAGELR